MYVAPDDAPDSWATDPSLRVVETVAEADGIDPEACYPPLNDVVDPAALDQIFLETGPAAPFRQVSFEYRGYDVTVHSDDRVTLE
ncbi:HalOD1 output domain-containing protein [Saliphagus sp. GCM10025334]